MEMGTKQAAFPGAGAGLGPPPGRVGLGADTRAWGGGGWGSLRQGRAPGPGRQTPGLRSLACSERAHELLPADPFICTLHFSLSVRLVPDAVWGGKDGGCLGRRPPLPWNGPVCAAMVLCCGCPLREDITPCSIPALTAFITVIINGALLRRDGGRTAGRLQESPRQGFWPLGASPLNKQDLTRSD